MRLPTSLTIAALAGTALAAPPAHAAWSPSTLLDTGGQAASAPILSPARGGGATVLFRANGAAARAIVAADGSTTAFDPLSGAYDTAAADARGRAVLARVTTRGTWPLRVRLVRPDGGVSGRLRVAFETSSASLAVNRAGDAVIAARTSIGVVAATGNVRFGFGAAQTLSKGGVTSVDTAIDADGGAVVAFARKGRLHVSDRPAGEDGRFSTPRRVGTAAMAESPELAVALGDGGSALVAYTDGRRFLAATRADRGAAWTEPQLLVDGLTGAGVGPDAEVVGDTAFLAYTDDRTVRFTQGPVGAALPVPAQLSAPGAGAGGVSLAANAAGDVAVLFLEDFAARAAVKPADAAMGAAQTIDTAGTEAIDVAAAPGGAGRFIAAVETGRRPKSSRQIRISTFAP